MVERNDLTLTDMQLTTAALTSLRDHSEVLELLSSGRAPSIVGREGEASIERPGFRVLSRFNALDRLEIEDSKIKGNKPDDCFGC